MNGKQFSDSFVGLTVFVEKRLVMKLKNIFLHDRGGNLRREFHQIFHAAQNFSIIASDGIRLMTNRLYFEMGPDYNKKKTQIKKMIY